MNTLTCQQHRENRIIKKFGIENVLIISVFKFCNRSFKKKLEKLEKTCDKIILKKFKDLLSEELQHLKQTSYYNILSPPKINNQQKKTIEKPITIHSTSTTTEVTTTTTATTMASTKTATATKMLASSSNSKSNLCMPKSKTMKRNLYAMPSKNNKPSGNSIIVGSSGGKSISKSKSKYNHYSS